MSARGPDRADGVTSVAVTVEQLWQPVPGGSGTYVTELLRALATRPGLAVQGLAAAHRRPPRYGDAPPGAVVHAPLPRRVLYDAWNTVALPRAEHVVRGLDVVHATTWAVPRTRRPLVVTVHDLAFLRDPGHFTPRGVRFFTRSLARVVDEADLVVVPSEATAVDCHAAGIEPARTVVVPHGVRVAVPAPEDVAAFRARHGLGGPYVLWTGTHEPRKNLPRLLEAAALLPDVDLVLVGPTGWGAGAPAGPRVHRLGRLSWSDLQVAYAGAAAFCYPSLWEGFGLPVLEAMAHGVPVVTSAGTSMAEVADDAAVLVDPLDPEAIAAGLRRALGAEAGTLAAAGRARSAVYTWHAVATAMHGVYLRAQREGRR